MAKTEDILIRIGAKLTYYREQKGMNQSDLARELNKDRQVIQRLEKGRVNVTIKTLNEICIELEIDMNDLFSE